MQLYDLFERSPYRRQSLLEKLEPLSDDPLVFIHFTDVLKLGMNPSSEWDDPLAIYSYPVQQIYESLSDLEIPFAGHRRYVYIFKSTGLVLELQDYDEDMFDADLQRIERTFRSSIMAPLGDISDPKLYWDHSIESWMSMFSQTPGNCFWEVTKRIARHIVKREPTRDPRMVWNKIIRCCNYDAIVDRGAGIISSNEPAQGCFLDLKAIQPMDTAINDLIRTRP